MDSVPFHQKTYPLGAEPNLDCDKALAAADALEDEELVRKLYKDSNEG